MFNRSEIMKQAWATVKDWYRVRNRPFKFVAADFAHALRCAWAAAKLAAANPVERRAVAICEELAGLKFKSFRINIEPRQRALEAELRSLAA